MTKNQNKAIQDFINNSLKIDDVIRSYGFELRQETEIRLGMRCPFHNERTGSFKVYTNNNDFYCFGCDQGGKVVEFIMLQEQKTRDEVLDRFRDNVDVESNKFAIESIIKGMNKPRVNAPRFAKDMHFDLRIYLRDFLKKNPDKASSVDSCFKEMRMFFFNPDNTDESLMRKFSDDMMDKAKQ